MYNSFFKYFGVFSIILIIYTTFISIVPISENNLDNETFAWPLPGNKNITCQFGPRKAPTSGASSFHYGIDIGAKEGTPIHSCLDGKVVFIGFNRSKRIYYNSRNSKSKNFLFTYFS